ncbi:MAG: 30S ribosomal protein S6 [Candidatus Atribacteria bacterium]|nr:30S ribosomal protein S6 [Candidatus Atribacteria bacterium]
MNRYELGIVVKPTLSEGELNALVEKMKGLVTEQGGEIESVNLWGKRRLAYPVEKHNEGYYVFFRFLLSPAKVEEIGRVARLTEEILRYILVKEEKREEHPSVVQEEKVSEPPSDEVIGDVSAQSE